MKRLVLSSLAAALAVVASMPACQNPVVIRARPEPDFAAAPKLTRVNDRRNDEWRRVGKRRGPRKR